MIPVPESVLIRRLYWTSFALRFAIALLAWVLTEYARIPFMEDATYYSEMAARVATSWLSGEQSTWMTGAMEGGRSAWFMVAVLAVFYCLTGGIEVVPLAMACYCLLTAWTPVLAYRASRRLGMSLPEALIAARLVAYSPAFVFWSAALYKEGLILIILFILIEHMLRLQEAVEPFSIAVLTGCLLALFGLRFYIAIILMGTLVAGATLGRAGRQGAESAPPIFRQVVVLLLLFTAFSSLGLQDRVQEYMGEGVQENLLYLNDVRHGLARESSGYLRDTNVATVDDAVGFLPVGLAYFLTVPLPWQYGSLRLNLAIPETVFWIVVVYPRALRGFRRGARSNPQGTLFLALSALAMCCLYALFMGNIGTAYRMRTQVWAIFALFAGWGWRTLRPAPPPDDAYPDSAAPDSASAVATTSSNQATVPALASDS